MPNPVKATQKAAQDYFRYFATPPEMNIWGLAVTASGFTRIPPGACYPMSAHPDDHALNWKRGRRLDALQIVLITEGRGQFETRQTGLLEIGPGAVFALLPGVWHRYQPDTQTGWVESWLEVRGSLVNRLISKKVINAAQAVRTNVFATEMEASLQRVHAHSRETGAAFDPARNAAAYAVLTAWEQAGRIESAPLARLHQAVGQLEHILAERYTESVNVRELSKKLGVAYSHLRRAFKQHTSYAPWQYVINLRMAHARRLLASTDMTLDEAAAQLGFSSGFHLSSAFKQAHGASPHIWRRNLAKHGAQGYGRPPAQCKQSPNQASF